MVKLRIFLDILINGMKRIVAEVSKNLARYRSENFCYKLLHLIIKLIM